MESYTRTGWDQFERAPALLLKYTPDGAAVGLIFLILALLVIIFLCVLKQTFYQIEGPNFSEKDMNKWQIHRPRAGGKKIDRFIEIIKEQVNK